MDETNPESKSPRFHALDALRGFALLLGVFYHAAESFQAEHWNWAIVDVDPSRTLEFARFVSHCFRMEVFFLLAGFFARLVILKRGARSFLHNRIQRILIPLIVGWVLIFPLLIAIWITGVQKSGNYQFIAIPEEARQLPVWKLWVGFILTGGWWRQFSLGHLWFLHQLLVLYALLGLGGLLAPICDPQGRVRAWLDRVLFWLLESRARFLPFALPTVGMLFLMPDWTVSTPMNSLIPEFGPTVLYGFCFLVGWWLHRQRPLLSLTTQGWPWGIGVASIAISASWWSRELLGSVGLGEVSAVTHRVVFTIGYAIAMWGFTFGFLGLFLARVRGESRFWRYTADSSYWVYLAHLPLVTMLQVWVADWLVWWPLKYGIILGLAVPILYLSYHYLVRSTRIGEQLNGRRWPFQKWPPWITCLLRTNLRVGSPSANDST